MIQYLMLLSLAMAEPDGGFRDHVRPILVESCLTCHSGEKPKGKLDLTREAAALKGGENGPGVVPGKPDESLIVEKVESGEMPPQHPLDKDQAKIFRSWITSGGHYEGEPLVASPKRAGADWWSLRPITNVPVPKPKDAAWARNFIDVFILERLLAEGLSPAPEADKVSLIRRVAFDLTGLPPTPEEVDAFVNDKSATAYESLVDRLLASPRYGERWGRHWLDIVRFGESHGYEMNTLRPNAWPYRDYVIRAFNQDTPLPRFALEQFAGDTLADGDTLIKAATGFLVGGVHDMVGNATIEGKKQIRADDLDDMITAAGSAFLGLTINCARCHDHKFDPISQADYYRMQAIFAGVQHSDRTIEAPDAKARQIEAVRLNAEIDRVDAELDATGPLADPASDRPRRPAVNVRRNVERFATVTARALRFTVLTSNGAEPCIDELEVFSAGDRPTNVALATNGAKATASSVYQGSELHKIVHLNDNRHGNDRSWISGVVGKGWARIDFAMPVAIDRVVWGRDFDAKYADRLATTYYIEVETDPGVWRVVASSSDRAAAGAAPEPSTNPQQTALLARRSDLAKRLADTSATIPIYAGTFGDPGPTHRLERGDPMRLAERLSPGAPKVIQPPLELPVDAPEADRRVAFARWIGDPANPLPARVMVNRAWHYHFGRGLVGTPSDFGFQGGIPSHPALLDWLAHAYQAGGYRLKPIHRLIVMSATYRQSAQTDPKAMAVDRDNRLLWHRPPHRLEAESIRDAMLFVAGSLDTAMGGPGYSVWEPNTNYVVVFTPRSTLGPDTFRRMVYQFKPRSQHDPTFGAFDCPDGSLVAPRRNASTTALQALNLLNSGFVLDQSDRLASRVKREAGDAPDGQVDRAFRLAFGRTPSPRERDAAVSLIKVQGLATLARALFNTNEFLYAP
jgi:hypothetical protein